MSLTLKLVTRQVARARVTTVVLTSGPDKGSNLAGVSGIFCTLRSAALDATRMVI
jgi:hypothetical protein